MTWLAWRQFRAQATVIFGALLLLAIPVVVTGIGTRHWVAQCTTAGTCLGGSPAETYMAGYAWVQILLRGGLLVLPAITGMFCGAPLVAREIDTGTHRLVWTQSVSRVRWLTVKVLMVGFATVLASGLLSWMTTWWYGPADQVNADKFVDSTFGIRDVVPVGYAAFAFAVGLAAGVVLRKVLPAMATTLVVFVAARMLVQMFVRAHYVAPLTEGGPLLDPSGDNALKQGSAMPSGSWAVTTQIFDPSGHLLHGPLRFGPEDACAATQTCLNGYTQNVLFQPGSRYWAFQWIETGLFTAIALLLIGFSYWWLTGRRLPGRTPRSGRSALLRATPAAAAQPAHVALAIAPRDVHPAPAAPDEVNDRPRRTAPTRSSGAD
jgi:ABC-type transport system involved in multi-copper enzyme maturation permease subunit